MTKISEPLPPLSSGPGPLRLTGAAVAALAGILGVLFVDPNVEFHAVEQYLLWAGRRFKLDNYFTATEPLGGYVALIVAFWGVAILAGRKRAYLGTLLIALIISGITVGVMKEGFGRARPDYSILLKESNSERKRPVMTAIAHEYPHLELELDWQGNIEDQSIWLLWDRPYALIGKNQFTSYPSGHANQAFVLAVFFTAFCRGRGKVLWYLLAIGCALSRVRYERHFPTDLLLGGAIGYATAHMVLAWEWPVRLGAKIFRVPLDEKSD